MLFLAALSRRPRTLGRVAELTALSFGELARINESCRRWGLVAEGLHLTDAGRRELDHAKSIRLRSLISNLHGSVEPYYPRSLRVGR